MAQALPHAVAVDIPADSVFKDYYTELSAVLDTLQGALSAAQAAATTSPATATAHLAATDQHLSDATDLLTTLEMEAQSAGTDARLKLLPHVSAQRDRLIALRGDVRSTRRLANSRLEAVHRDALFEQQQPGDDDARIRMSDNVSDLEAAGKSIYDSRRAVSETEAVGASILEDLQNQRATLLRARGNLGNVDSGLQQSDSIITTMYRRAVINKIVIYLVFAAVALAVLAIVYVRLFHTSGGGGGGPATTTAPTPANTTPGGNTTSTTSTG